MNKYRSKIRFHLINRKNIPVLFLFLYFLFIAFLFLKQEQITKDKVLTTLGLFIIWVIIMVYSMIEISVVKKKVKIFNGIISTLLLIVAPAASFVMVEVMVSNYNSEMFKLYALYNLIWYFVIYFLIFVLIRNVKYTIILADILIYLTGMLNYFIFLFRGNPIIPSDLLAWRTGMSVAPNYELSFTKGFLVATIIMFFIYSLGCKFDDKKIKFSVTNRLAVLGVYILSVAIVFHIFFHTDFINTKIRVIDYFAPKYTYSTYGAAFGFVANVKAMQTKKPEGYSINRVKEVLENVSAQATQIDLKEMDTKEKPNLIVIMNEAYSDLSLVGDYHTNIEYRPFTGSLEENTTKGTLYVSVFGGATSDTEYEFLTGNSMAVMPQNSVPYQQYVTEPTDSLAATLRAQGYYNIAIHPFEGSGYKRDFVYPLLGFDEFLTMDDFINPEMIRSYISDRESYNKIIEKYENLEDKQPLFIFNVTMQDHGGYSSEQLFPDEETVRLTNLEGFEDVEQYLSLLRNSDQSFEILVDYFSMQEEPTIILMFGDHQPIAFYNFYNAETSYPEDYQQKYAVPFLLWANYDIEEDDVDKLSGNYLSSYLLKIAGLQGTPYNDYLIKLQKEIPVINALFYMDKFDNIYSLADQTEYTELIKEYKNIGYNNALDKRGKLRDLFTLKKETVD